MLNKTKFRLIGEGGGYRYGGSIHIDADPRNEHPNCQIQWPYSHCSEAINDSQLLGSIQRDRYR